jgi:hypothetical protein
MGQKAAYYENAFISLFNEKKNEFYVEVQPEMPIDLTFKRGRNKLENL